ncbi:MAG: hypothetical protein QW244_03055 [Candidatus Pacearchaeota archaeon]
MIKQKFAELKRQPIFKLEKGFQLFLVFCITDSSLNIEQIDFSFISSNSSGKNKNEKEYKPHKIKNFSFKGGVWQFHKSEEEKNFGTINIKDVKDIPELLPKIKHLLEDKKLSIDKFIFILENKKGSEIYSVTCLCKDFFVYKITFDAKTLNLLDTKMHNLFDFFQIKKV